MQTPSLQQSLAIFAGLCFFTLAARAEDCTSFSEWLIAHEATIQTNGLDAKATAEDNEIKVREKLLHALFQSYLRNEHVGSQVKNCTATLPDRGNFYFEMNRVFFEETLKTFRQSNSTTLRSLIELLDKQSGPTGVPLFSMKSTSLSSENSDPSGFGAGFHRASGTLYLDIDRISPDQWFVTFAHELLHSLDQELTLSIRAYASSDIPKKVAQLPDDATLSTQDQAALEAWLRAGLGRGLWAEYRAWVPSFKIYLQGKNEKLWKPIPWMEELLATRAANETIETMVYRYLDSRSEDPTTGIFSKPLVQRELRKLRQKIRDTGELPTLGILEQVR